MALLKPNFMFPVEVNAPKGIKGAWMRYCARKTARMLAEAPFETFQIGGYDGALKKNYLMVDADKYQIIHWILQAAGYYCTHGQILERSGFKDKQTPVVESPKKGMMEWIARAKVPWLKL